MKIRCIIVDDEAPARDELNFLLSHFEDVEVVAEANNASKALDTIEKLRPHVVFLDIQMPRADGFSVIHGISHHVNPPLFVMVTAYDTYAVKAFEANAVDYLLKPISEARLEKTIKRIRHQLSEQGHLDLKGQVHELLTRVLPEISPIRSVKIVVESGGRLHLLSPQEVIFCRLENGRIMVHTFNRAFLLHGLSTMDQLERHLDGLSFFRAHRSILVNLDHIREFSPWFNGKYCLVMDDETRTELTVSRGRVGQFKKKLGI